VLRIGFNKQNRNGYIFVGNSDWQSLVPGVDYQMTAQFGNLVALELPGAWHLLGRNNDADGDVF